MKYAPRQIFATALVLSVGFSLGLLTGCGSNSGSPANPTPPPSNTPSFQGKVVHGAQAVAGAHVQLYAAGSSGYGSAATSLLAATVTTDATGAFTVPAGSYSCASASTQLYLVATGGSLPSGSSNAALAMMSAWGNCGDLQSTTSITINEATTVAAVWALAPFMTSGTQVGTSSTNQAGLANAMVNARLLADVASGTSPAASLPSNETVESAKLYTAANVLGSCVASGAACSTLFAAVTAGSETQPTDTLGAALRMAKNPGRNVGALYALASAPYTGLGSAPNDFTLSVAISGGGMTSPASLAIDSTGRAWEVSYGGTVSAFTPQGTPVFASGVNASGTAQDYGLTIDPSDNVWVTNGGQNSVSKFTSAGSLLSGSGGFTAGGISYPIAAAADAGGNIWVVDNGNGSVARLANDGSALSPSTGYTGGGVFVFPVAVAVTASGNAWIASQNGAATLLSATGSVMRTVSCCAIPTGIAVDANGDAWVSDHYASSVVHVSGSTGAVLSSTVKSGGLLGPYGLAIDGAGSVWVVNASNNTVSEIAGAGSANAGAALSPATGYGVSAAMQAPYGIAIDASGNLWVSSYGNAHLVRFIGLAAPVKTPLVSASQLP